MSIPNHKPYHDNIKTQIFTQITVPPIFAGIIFSLYIFAGPNLFPQVDISEYMHCLRFDFHFARRLLLRQYRWWVTHSSLTASGGWFLFFLPWDRRLSFEKCDEAGYNWVDRDVII